MNAVNLDVECAKLAAKLAEPATKDTENSITKALGVLEEQGVYAMFQYLHAREKKNEWGKAASQDLTTFLRKHALLGPATKDEPWEALRTLGNDLDKLLFARELLHRALVYARYHAKAGQAGGTEPT